MNLIDEDLLIANCKNGKRESFGPLINPYRRKLFSYLLKMTGDKNEADDIFQEALIRTWQGLPKYSGQCKFSSWLFTIAHNAAMDFLRKKIKKRNREINTENVVELSGSGNPYIDVVAGEIKLMISNAVEKLTLKQKDVFLLRTHGEMSFKEIAETTGEPLNTVISHMHYAVKKLRKILRHEDAKE